MNTSPFAQPAPYDADAYIPPQAEAPSQESFYGPVPADAYHLLVQSVAKMQTTEERQEHARKIFGDTQAYRSFMAFVQIEVDKKVYSDQDRFDRIANDVALEMEAKLAGKKIFEEKQQAALINGGDALADAFADGLLDTDGLDGIELPEPLVENYLDLDTTARIYGPSRSLKSFVTLDMAACVAAGIPWHGNATVQRKVLYVVAEGVSGIPSRVRAWEKAHGRKMTGVRFHTKAVQLTDPEEMTPLIAHAKREGYGLIIFDTQARCTVGLDENSNTEMGRMVAAVDALRRETGACVMLVHHSGAGEKAKGRARGATAIMGAMDAEFEVERKEKAMSVKLITRKRKDGPEGDDLHLRVTQYDVVTVRGADTSLAVSSATTRPVEGTDGEDEDEVVSERSLTAQQVSVLEDAARYSEAPQGSRTLAKDLGIGQNRVSEACSDLVKLGCLKRVGPANQPKYEITQIGWVVLNRLELTVGYHQVAPLGDSDA